MITLQSLQKKVADELSELYEAFFAAQESLEENEYIAPIRRITKPLARGATTLGNCKPHAS